MSLKRDILELEIRRKIYDFIDKNPGLHIREISRRMNIPTTTLKYHIRCFKKLGLFEEKSEGEYKLVYVSQKIGKQEKQILSLLRQEIPCKIFLYLCFVLSCSVIELSKELEMSHSLVLYHIKKLLDMGLIEEAPVRNDYVHPFPGYEHVIERKPVGTEKFYRMKSVEIINATWRVLIARKHSLADESIIDSYIDFLESSGYKFPKEGVVTRLDRVSKKMRGVDSYFDSVIKLLFYYFRPPFCA